MLCGALGHLQGRGHRDWAYYDTDHAVFRPRRMTPDELEAGHKRAYREFLTYGSILRRSFGAAFLPWALTRGKQRDVGSARAAAVPLSPAAPTSATEPEASHRSKILLWVGQLQTVAPCR